MTFDDILTLDIEEFEDLIYDKTIITEVQKAKPVYQARWRTTWESIYQHLESGRYFRYTYDRGSTEQQEVDRNYNIEEVYPVEVTVVVYRNKKEQE